MRVVETSERIKALEGTLASTSRAFLLVRYTKATSLLK